MTELDPKNYPSNSIEQAEKEEPKKRKKITTGTIIKQDEPLISRIIYSENAKSIASYILWDVLVPAAKSTITDMITSIPELLFYNEGRSSGLRRDKSRSYVSYQSYYDNKKERRPRRATKSRATHRFNDILIESKWEAEEVLESLVELVDTYEVATVADFYAAVGINADFTDNKWGWDNLSEAYAKRVRGGYALVLPKPIELD